MERRGRAVLWGDGNPTDREGLEKTQIRVLCSDWMTTFDEDWSCGSLGIGTGLGRGLGRSRSGCPNVDGSINLSSLDFSL